MGKNQYKVLYITPFSLTKLNNGGSVRSWNIAKQLAKKFNLTVYCYSEKTLNREIKDLSCVKMVIFPINTKIIYKIIKYLQWVLCGVSRNTFTFVKNKYLSEMINKEIPNNHAIIVETILMAPIINKWDSKKLFVISHQNNESSIYKDMAQRENIFKKYLLSYDSYKIFKDENKYMRKFDINYFVSENDVRAYKDNHFFNVNSLLLPNGVDTEKYVKNTSKKRSKEILFIGTYKWAPNIDAVNYFLDTIWMKVLEVCDDAIFLIIGSGGGKRKKWEQIKNVKYVGEVIDPKEYYQRAKAMVVPLITGGGTRLKILEAMACGLPVISTKKGVEGLNLTEGKEYLLAKTTEDFVNNIALLINNQYRWDELSNNGIKVIKKHYSWNKIGIKLQNEIISYIKRENG